MTPLETPNRLTPASLAAGAAIAYELHALDHLEPGLTPSGLRTPPSFLCTSPQPKMSPGAPDSLTPATPPPRELRSGKIRRRPRPKPLEPSDLEPVAEIRSQTDQIWTFRSESNG